MLSQKSFHCGSQFGALPECRRCYSGSGRRSCLQRCCCSGKIVAAASFNAMAEFTRAVGGDYVCVETLIPGGTEPHDFTPTVRT